MYIDSSTTTFVYISKGVPSYTRAMGPFQVRDCKLVSSKMEGTKPMKIYNLG